MGGSKLIEKVMRVEVVAEGFSFGIGMDMFVTKFGVFGEVWGAVKISEESLVSLSRGNKVI